MSEIALIPRTRGRIGKKERVAFVIKANEEEEAKALKDKNCVRQAARSFERKIAEDRAMLGLKPTTGNERQQHAYFRHGGNGKAYFINQARGNF